MTVRRLLGVVSAVVVVLFAVALPAQADDTNHSSDGHHPCEQHHECDPHYPSKHPTISITKTRVMVGGNAVVTVTGCKVSPGGTATVTVASPGHHVTETQSVPVDANGKIVATVHFSSLGSNVVSVSCADPKGGTLIQSVTVHVVPSHGIWEDHDVAHQGDKVKVWATGYGDGSRATITVTSFEDAVVLSTTATADSTGAVTATLPFAKAGTYDVKVLGVSVAGAPLSQSLSASVLGSNEPHTGVNLVPISVGGAGLLLAGGGLVLVARRRRASRV